MTESNILPYDGAAILIDDHGAGFDWPAIHRDASSTPFRGRSKQRGFSVERCRSANDRLGSVTVLIPRGILHLPAPFPQSSSA